MSRVTKLELEQRLAAALAENVALREQLSIQQGEHEAFASRARREYVALREQLRAGAQRREPEVGAVVSTYTKRDGSAWAKVRIGHGTYAHRPLAQ